MIAGNYTIRGNSSHRNSFKRSGQSDNPYMNLMQNSNRPPKEPFFNFTEPMPAYVAGFIILMFALLAYVPMVFTWLAPLVVLMPLGFQGATLTEQMVSLAGHGLAHGGWGHVLMNAGMIAVLGIATVKGARLNSVAMGRRRNPSLVFLTILIFGVIVGGLAQWLWWFVISAPLGANAPAAVGASGGASALLATAAWAIGGMKKMKQFALGWVLINAVIVAAGPLIGMNVAWAAHIGGFIGGMILAPSLIKANSARLGV